MNNSAFNIDLKSCEQGDYVIRIGDGKIHVWSLISGKCTVSSLERGEVKTSIMRKIFDRKALAQAEKLRVEKLRKISIVDFDQADEFLVRNYESRNESLNKYFCPNCKENYERHNDDFCDDLINDIIRYMFGKYNAYLAAAQHAADAEVEREMRKEARKRKSVWRREGHSSFGCERLFELLEERIGSLFV